MTKLHLPPPFNPGSLDPERAPNGATPRASYLRRAADGMNTIATYHKKLLTAKAQSLYSISAASATVAHPWPFYFRTGENTVGVRVMIGLVATDYGAAVNPRVDLSINLASDGSGASSRVVNFNSRDAPTYHWQIPNHTSHSIVNMTGLSPDTEYYFLADARDGARITYLTAHEIAELHANDSVTGVVDPSKFLTDGPIYDEHVEDLLDAGEKHWRHGGTHLLSWNPDYDATPLPWTATTYTNLIDGTSTSRTAATPGVTLAALHKGTATTGAAGPAVKMAVEAVRTVGSGTLDVQLTDGTNTISVTGITTGGVGSWYTATGNIPDATSKWDLMAKVSSGTFEIYGVSLFYYDTGGAGSSAPALPADATEWAATFPSITVPDAIWPMQDATQPLLDAVGSFDLNTSNASGDERLQEDDDELGRYCVLLEDVASNLRLAGTSDLNPGTGDFSFFCRFKSKSGFTPGGSYYFARKRGVGGTSVGWSLRYLNSSGDLSAEMDTSGATQVSVSISGDHADDNWHYVAVAIDRTAQTITLFSDLGTDTASISAHGASTLSNSNYFGFGDTNELGAGCAENYYSYACAWLGVALTQADFDEMTGA